MSHMPRNQNGAALVVVLLLLLIVTLLGLAAMRGAILQERMAGATLQRGEAFHAAESALRQGEAAVGKARPTKWANDCSGGLCAMTVPPNKPAWAVDGFSWKTKGTEVTLSDSKATAHYVVEDYGQSEQQYDSLDPQLTGSVAAAEVYRIVAHAETASGSQVTLQSIYRVKR